MEAKKAVPCLTLLESIKNFMDDLSNITNNKNFIDYQTIINHIDTSKVKSYIKLINGFKNFFESNTEPLLKGDFESLKKPNIEYVTDNGIFEFNFQQIFKEAEECEQDTIKDHLNHIWVLLNNEEKCPEEVYIDKIFKDLKAKFSPDLSREEQMTLAKDLFSDFQRQNMDVSIVIKVACQKARELLLSNGSDDHSKTLTLIDAVEKIDINNFDMIQFMGLVGQVGTLFSDGESNPLSSLLSSVLTDNALIPIEGLSLEDENDH
jgi:hypothetical protein